MKHINWAHMGTLILFSFLVGTATGVILQVWIDPFVAALLCLVLSILTGIVLGKNDTFRVFLTETQEDDHE